MIVSCKPSGVKVVLSDKYERANKYVLILIISGKAKGQRHSFSLRALGKKVPDSVP